ncbi:MAG: acyltransferase [Bacteroidales bacterium]|nr:acyltransferase [Bacteroidales bacterium]
MRQSNLELLRIVSMMMVLVVHADGASLGLPEPSGDIGSLDSRDVWRLAVEAIAIIGVNCFTIISGYFGIRLRWRSIASFLLQCVFYAVLTQVVVGICRHGHISPADIGKSCLVLTHTDLWYVPAYFCLMLLSPMLNAGLDSLSRRDYTVMLTLFVAFNLWCGWWWGGRFNPTGYTPVQLILVYMLGRYIRLHIDVETLRLQRVQIAALYAMSVAAIFFTAILLPSNQAFAYNSPAVLLATVSFFALFLTFDFKSRLVNYAARSSFAVYLIHKAPPVWTGFMKPAVRSLWCDLSLTRFTLAMLGLCVAIYLTAMLIDSLRRRLSDLILHGGACRSR